MTFPKNMNRREVVAGALALSFAAQGAYAASSPKLVVETKTGKVRGVREGGTSVFRGIPYGLDTQATRFAAPKPAPSWSGIRDATRFGQRAPQSSVTRTAGYLLGSSWKDQSNGMGEDCLFLNVWTPAADDNRRPVMVWFHGGGFASGSGASELYNSVRLAADEDLVVVTVNHRLGPLGFLYLAELGGAGFEDSGQAGMLDLVQSLRWVRDNIAAFGGDPRNVTVFGQSGGGGKVSLLLGMPAAKGLFHKAIIQSGPYLRGANPEESTRLARKTLANLNLTPGNIGAIRTMPVAQILAALGDNSRMVNRLALVPTTDGRNLPRDPFAPDATPLVADVPLMIGATRWEYIYQFGMEDRSMFDLTWETLPLKLQDVMDQLSMPIDVPKAIAHYHSLYPDRTPPYVFFSILTDARMLRRSIGIAERKALQPAPVYMYNVEWPTPVDGGRWKSPHVLDVPFVFKTVDKASSLMGAGPVQDRLSAEMSSAWAAFARSGNPNVKLLPEWPRYEPGQRATMLFDTVSTVAYDPVPNIRTFWPV